ncbi:MAG: tripartite tricarboxylate transporter substrate binding protein [Spirochaetaceae bacterium]|jgi:tripartite-type tricarboxylate transporter receptor subunit TctC|nr:tripartite tricarboxylate transporter substrate binding protein [Spirochaetaceae bacterium]
MRKIAGLFFVAIILIAAGCSKVEKYPSKQIGVVVGASAGGTSDVVTRFLAKAVEGELGVPLVVTNKAGGSSAVATEYMTAQKPDGYNIMYMPVESAMIKALGLSNIEPKDIRYFARAMTLPAAIAVNAESPYKSFEELIEFAKTHPGEIKTGNAGTGSIWHFAAVGIEKACGVKFNHVPFDGGAAAATALMGGHIDLVTVAPGEIKSGVESGKLRVLAIADNQRSALYPDVPAFAELGYTVEVLGWGTFAAPGNTPDDVLKVLEDSFAKAIQSKEFEELCVKYGLTPAYLNAADTQKFAEEQAAWYQKEIPSLNLR